MSKFIVVNYVINSFHEPQFHSAEQAEEFAQSLTDALAEITYKMGVRWDEVDWSIEEVEEENEDA
jgi:hypothetical protein